MNPMISFRGVYKKYGEKTVLHKVDLDIERGEFLTIVGSSGGGKTTLMKMINGLVTPSGGDIFLDGKNIKDLEKTQLRRQIGYAIQGSVLFPHMSIGENIAYVPNLINRRDRKKTKEAVDKWMQIVGLEKELAERYPDELSGGQQQRVGIARALAASPEILLMDEPFGAVDEITRGSLQDEISRIHRETGITILFVTHDIHEALKLGTKILVISDGTIHQYGTSEELIKNPKTEFVEKLVEKERKACLL